MINQDDKLILIQKLLASAKGNIHSAEQMLKSITGTSPDATSQAKEKAKGLSSSVDGKVIEGIFNGVSMIGPEEKEYKVPENYSSKSKLVQGDVLKLTIADDGSFIFKQIGPVPRRKIIGDLSREGDSYSVIAEGEVYKLLTPSVTYHKAEDGDQVTIIVPEGEESEWAALENVVRSGNSQDGNIEPVEQDIKENIDEIVREKVEEKEEVAVEVPENITESEPMQAAEEAVTTHKPDSFVAPESPEETGEGVKELEI